MIDVTGIDLVKFAQKVYELSMPQGLGFLHFTPEPLSEEEAKRSLRNDGSKIALDMDYVDGRACKMVVFREGEKLEIRDAWYDHTNEQFSELLDAFGIVIPVNAEHGGGCNCINCQASRRSKTNN